MVTVDSTRKKEHTIALIKFALFKLSNPDKDKPDDKSIKKVLQTIASMSTLAGAGMGSSVLAGTSFIGGNILGIMSQDEKTVNYKYTKVNNMKTIAHTELTNVLLFVLTSCVILIFL